MHLFKRILKNAILIYFRIMLIKMKNVKNLNLKIF